MKTTMNNIKNLFRKSSFALIIAVAFIAASCEEEEMLQPASNEQELMDIPSTLNAISENPENYISENSKLKIDVRSPFWEYQFMYLRMALEETGLIGTVMREQLTVFAPTDKAFENLLKTLGVGDLSEIPADLLKDVLLYHTVNGKVYSSSLSDGYYRTVNGASLKIDLTSGVKINTSRVTMADINALNGVIHVIDEVMLPPTIVDLAMANDNFSILVQAVAKAGLVETLQSRDYTVFAPTNDAFIALLDELGASSLDDVPVDRLTEILLYHVVPGSIYSKDLPAEPLKVIAANGDEFTVDVTSPKIRDIRNRDASITLVDISGTNGVIHAIDRVIIPFFRELSR